MGSRKRNNLLLIAILLLLLRFAVVPVLQRHAELRTQRNQIAQQLQRTRLRVSQKQTIAVDLQQQQQIEQAWIKEYPRAESSARLRIVLQQNLQKMATDHQVQLTLFDWVAQFPTASKNVEVHNARIVFQGFAEQLMDALLAIQAAYPGINISEFEFKQSDRSSQQALQRTSVTVLVQITGWVGNLPEVAL